MKVCSFETEILTIALHIVPQTHCQSSLAFFQNHAYTPQHPARHAARHPARQCAPMAQIIIATRNINHGKQSHFGTWPSTEMAFKPNSDSLSHAQDCLRSHALHALHALHIDMKRPDPSSRCFCNAMQSRGHMS